MNLRYFLPVYDSSVNQWALEARLLRWLTFLWLFVGLIILFSASYPVADVDFGDGLYYVKRQLVWVVVGLIGFNILVHCPIRYVLAQAKWLIFVLIALLYLTLVPGLGTTVNGATRWLALGPIPIQASELIKPFLVLQSALVFGQWWRLRPSYRFTWLAIFGAILVGIVLQPNLSTTALCGLTLWLVALAAGLPYSQLGGTALSGLFLGCLSLMINEYQRRRILSFLNPWADPLQDGYQLVQSLLAVGSGGFWGTGLGMSQQKLYFLPIRHSDFIFSVYAEEFGFMGGVALLLMLGLFATLALRVAIKAKQIEHQLIAIGVMVLLVGQSLINIAVATGALPTTGLPLPMFSYGGSSMIASLLLAGLLIRVAREESTAQVVAFPNRQSRRRRGKLRKTVEN